MLLVKLGGLESGSAFGVILDFTGGIASSLICFVLPAAIFIKLTPKTHPLFFPCVAMSIFGLFVVVTVPVITIISFTEK